MTGQKISSDKIKTEALRLGFSVCGIAKAEAVDEATARHYRQWIESGRQAEMHYMENHLDKRLDPRLLMDGLKTIVCVALNYCPAQRLPDGEYQIADYALGKDYHDIVKQKLHQLAQTILAPFTSHPSPLSPLEGLGGASHPSPLSPLEGLGGASHPSPPPSYRAFSDSAPVLERYWAARAGLGWIGRNRQLIIPPHHPSLEASHQHLSPIAPTVPSLIRRIPSALHHPSGGSKFFLGELFLNIEADRYDSPMKSRCGTCGKCLEACPTGAIKADDPCLDASRCLSYLTIENRNDIPEELAQKMGDTIYGCDRCQQACPWNRFSQPTSEPLLKPSPALLAMSRDQWHQLSREEFQQLFKGSAVKRAKYEGLMRNIRAVEMHNARTEEKRSIGDVETHNISDEEN